MGSVEPYMPCGKHPYLKGYTLTGGGALEFHAARSNESLAAYVANLICDLLDSDNEEHPAPELN